MANGLNHQINSHINHESFERSGELYKEYSGMCYEPQGNIYLK